MHVVVQSVSPGVSSSPTAISSDGDLTVVQVGAVTGTNNSVSLPSGARIGDVVEVYPTTDINTADTLVFVNSGESFAGGGTSTTAPNVFRKISSTQWGLESRVKLPKVKVSIAKRFYNVGNYIDFKLFVGLFGTNSSIYWANSPSNYMWIMNLDSTSDVAIWASGIALDNATIISDFPSAVQITTSNINSKLYSNTPIGTGLAPAGAIQFISYVYTEFKTLVSGLNLSSIILYVSGTNFTIGAYAADNTLNVQCVLSSQPSTFSTDFPSAIQVSGLPN